MKRVIPLLFAVCLLGFACRQQAIRTMNIRVPAMTDAEAAARVGAALKSVHGVRSNALVIDLGHNTIIASGRLLTEVCHSLSANAGWWMDPKTGDAYHALAYGFYMLGNYDQAWNHANTAKRLGTKIPEDLLSAIQKRPKQPARR